MQYVHVQHTVSIAFTLFILKCASFGQSDDKMFSTKIIMHFEGIKKNWNLGV